MWLFPLIKHWWISLIRPLADPTIKKLFQTHNTSWCWQRQKTVSQVQFQSICLSTHKRIPKCENRIYAFAKRVLVGPERKYFSYSLAHHADFFSLFFFFLFFLFEWSHQLMDLKHTVEEQGHRLVDAKSHNSTTLGRLLAQLGLGFIQPTETLPSDERPLAPKAASRSITTGCASGTGACSRACCARWWQCCHLHDIIDAALGCFGGGLRVDESTNVLGCLQALQSIRNIVIMTAVNNMCHIS